MASLAPCPAPHRLSDSAFNSLRLWVLVALCLLRLLVTRPHLQAYLCLAKSRVEQLRREAGCIEAREIQRRVWVPIVEGAWGAGWGFQSFQPGVSPSPEGHLPLLPAHQVVRVYCYVTVVSLQYLTPLVLTLNCTLLLKTLGERELPLGVGVRWGFQVGWMSLRQPWPRPPLPASLCLHLALSLHRWLLLGPGACPLTIPSAGGSPPWPGGPRGG